MRCTITITCFVLLLATVWAEDGDVTGPRDYTSSASVLAASASPTAFDDNATSVTAQAVVIPISGIAAATAVGSPLSFTPAEAAAVTAKAAAELGPQAAVAGSAVEVASTVPAPYGVILKKHNMYRRRHRAPPLTWNPTLAAQARAYASKCIWGHDFNNRNSGENLFASYSAGSAVSQRAILDAAITMWYDEVKQYSFSNPGFGMNTGHFTQVVWKGSRQLGCAIKACNSGLKNLQWPGGVIVVCRYSPPGNVMGSFDSNVLPAAKR
eukprot:gene9625-biopygen11521